MRLIDMVELESKLMAEIQCGGCDGVSVEIIRQPFNDYESNWSVRVVDYGNTRREAVNLAVITAQHRLRPKYILLG